MGDRIRHGVSLDDADLLDLFTGFDVAGCFDTCGGAHDTVTGPPDRSSTLERAIQSEVIPRLMLAHRESPDTQWSSATGATKADGPARAEPTAKDVTELTRLVLTHDTAICIAFVDGLLEEGVSLEAVFLELVSPAAKLLGEMWKADLCSFTDVTLGLAKLQQVVRTHAGAFEAECVDTSGEARRALLLAMPGEQHTLGIFLVEMFLRRAGWDVCGGPALSSDELNALIRREWFSVIGLSISADNLLGTLSGAIRTIRRESCNRNVGIMVGGRVFVDHPDWVAVVGADAIALEARQAVSAAENIVVAAEGRC